MTIFHRNEFQRSVSRRLVFKTWCFMWVGKIIITITSAIKMLSRNNSLITLPLLMIEAGKIGWTSVFYTELQRSATDYIHPNRVITSSIDRSKNYLNQSIKNLLHHKPTHFCFDPRTGSQEFLLAIFQTLILTILLTFLRITPIVILTDASVRQWRYQVFLLTAKTGVIVTFLDPKKMGDLIPHKRVIGPMFMPISIATLLDLEEKSKLIGKKKDTQPAVHFLGSLYSKRVTFFEELQLELRKIESRVIIKTQSKSAEIAPNSYWDKLANAERVITTTFQERDPNYVQDALEIDQLVFRVSETLAAECILFSSVAPGMEKFFTAGKDFIAYNHIADAAQKIEFYAQNTNLALEIAKHGHKTYRELIMGRHFWKHIEAHLEEPLNSTKGIRND